MKKIAIIAHFLSANFGDRYQASGFLKLCKENYKEIEILCINSQPIISDESEIQIDGNTYEIFSEKSINFTDLINDLSFVVMLTGSLASDSSFISLAQSLLKSNQLKKIFIWGGFHDITNLEVFYGDNLSKLQAVFSDHRVLFYSRGWLELSIYHMLTSIGRGMLAGDPVLLNFEEAETRSKNLSNSKSPVFIVNENFINNTNPDFLENTLQISHNIDSVISIENYNAEPFLSADMANVKYCGDLKHLREIITNTSVVITQRLHGFALSKALAPEVPVLFHIPHKLPFQNIKFQSVALGGIGYEMHMANIVPHISKEIFNSIQENSSVFENSTHESNFIKYSALSHNSFKFIIQTILQFD
jgi:hypothetical protein